MRGFSFIIKHFADGIGPDEPHVVVRQSRAADARWPGYHVPMAPALQKAFQWVEALTNLEQGPRRREYRLERMQRLLDDFANPQQRLTTVHIAGSKGKSSTAAFLAAMLSAAAPAEGYQMVGRYTSPHLFDYRERFVVLPRRPPEALLLRHLEVLRDYSEPRRGEQRPTTFELLTLLAYLVFEELGCRWVVVEAGLGGRLDATNVLTPRATIITPIELEHTEYLGNTLAAVAGEKAGIIKQGIPLFVGRQHPQALAPIVEQARRMQAPTYLLDDATWTVNADPGSVMADLKQRLTVELRFARAISPPRWLSFRLPMPGRFQAENAALALMAVTRLLPDIDDRQIERGISQADIPGRFQIICHRPPILLDGAHTPRSIAAVLEGLEPLLGGKAILIFGSVTGKRSQEMIAQLLPHFRHIIVSRPGTFRSSNPQLLYTQFRRALAQRTRQHPPITLQLVLQPDRALRRALRLARGRYPILIVGSFYLAGAIRVAFNTLPKSFL